MKRYSGCDEVRQHHRSVHHSSAGHTQKWWSTTKARIKVWSHYETAKSTLFTGSWVVSQAKTRCGDCFYVPHIVSSWAASPSCFFSYAGFTGICSHQQAWQLLSDTWTFCRRPNPIPFTRLFLRDKKLIGFESAILSRNKNLRSRIT